MDANARMYSTPMLMSLITKGLNSTPMTSIVQFGPNGMTANPMRAGTNTRMGARLNMTLFAPAGMMSSLKNNFSPSATGCKTP